MRQCQMRPDLWRSYANSGVTNSDALYSRSVTRSANLEYSAKLQLSWWATHETPRGNGDLSAAAHRTGEARPDRVSDMGAQERRRHSQHGGRRHDQDTVGD
jgi:hypothetical protein